MDLRNSVVNKLPFYYHRNDTYKDASGKGILIRFLGMLGISIQEDLVEPLENFINELDPETATSKFLSLLAFTVGSPIDILGTDASYRLRLMQAVSLYKLKGTAKSYRLLFNILGYTVTVEELFLPDMRYDIGLTYDTDNDGTIPYQYDNDKCRQGCVEYNLIVFGPDGESPPDGLTDQLKELLYLAIKDIEPINARLVEIKAGVGGIFTEQFNQVFL